MRTAILRIVEFLATACLGASASVALGQSFVPNMNENVDRFGTEYHAFHPSEPNATYCQSACLADVQCHAWTYNRPEHRDDGRPFCILKSHLLPKRIEAPGTVSGVVRPEAPLSQTNPDNSHGFAFGNERQLEILPVLFIPSDVTISPQDITEISDFLYAHLELAQKRLKSLLETDTFKIASGKLPVYHAKMPDSFYATQHKNQSHEASDFLLKEVLDWRHEDRNTSKYIYLIMYARRPGTRPDPYFGAGSPMNGRPNTGGGVVELELSSLLTDAPYGLQATIIHETGHAFGLNHADCYGYDQYKNISPMSYNPLFGSDGLSMVHPEAPMKFNPEDLLVLSQNKLAFPHFQFVQAKHNPDRKNLDRLADCYFPPMNSFIGPLKRR